VLRQPRRRSVSVCKCLLLVGFVFFKLSQKVNSFVTYFRLSGWFIVDADCALGTLQRVDWNSVGDVLVVLTSTLKMEAAYTSENSPTQSTSTWCKNPTENR
jgi:hypothetical protein